MINKDVSEKIHRAPQSPGVYIFSDEKGRCLYVGKAIRLQDRLKSYVQLGRDNRPSIPLMMPKIAQVEWFVTEHEKEALILENNLIKSYRPKYNIVYRDDKSYVSLKLTKHEFPRLYKTRHILQDGSTYFGPFSSVASVNQTLKLLQKIFQVRDCTDQYFKNRTRPCLRHQIGLCSAPCVHNVTREHYLERVLQIKDFMKGNTSSVVQDFTKEMSDAAKNQDYEKAALLRDRIYAINQTTQTQQAESRKKQNNTDVIGFFGDKEATLIKLLRMRDGKMVGFQEYFVEESSEYSKEILRSFVQHHYMNSIPSSDIPSEIIVKEEFPDLQIMLEFLSDTLGSKVFATFPKKGEKLDLMLLAEKNAQVSFYERKRKSETNQKALAEIQHMLEMKELPKRIEGYDISNFQGSQSYGSMVVFIDGERDRSKYRIFSIKTVEGPNDFASLKEVLIRRLNKIDPDNTPDVLLIDGGRGQLRQAVDTLKELNLMIPVLSIAKEKELVSRSGTKYAPERLFLPGQKNAIVLLPSSPVLKLFQRIRDEAHRFGISHHRRKRNKVSFDSLLKKIKGVGPKKQKILLQSFESLEAIQRATVQEIQSVSGIDEKTAASIFTYFQKTTTSNEEE